MNTIDLTSSIGSNQTLEKEEIMNLGNALGDAYSTYFQNEKIEELYKQALCLSKTKIELTSFFKQREELDYLTFDERIRFSIDEQTYIIFSLNGYVQEFVIGGEKQFLTNLDILHAIEILRLRNIPINLTYLFMKLKQLNLISFVYNYAYAKLTQKNSDQMDIIRAGMFKNAYYNILALKDQEYIKALIGSPFQTKTR